MGGPYAALVPSSFRSRGRVRQTVESVHATGFTAPVIYASFIHDELTQVRAADREAARMILFGRLPHAPVADAMRYEPSHVGLRHTTATRRLVEAFHSAGLIVFVYTANSPRHIRQALSLGIDGVISDFPERIEKETELSVPSLLASTP